MHPVLRPVERLIYRLTGVDEEREMRWTEYAAAMLLFSVVSMLVLYLIQRLQGYLPFNPQKLPGVDSARAPPADLSPQLSTPPRRSRRNTNWQSYVPEVTMSYLTQMAGLAYHNFASAATGIVLAIAFIRGIARREMKTIGNFWVDFVRCNLYVLLPFVCSARCCWSRREWCRTFGPTIQRSWSSRRRSKSIRKMRPAMS